MLFAVLTLWALALIGMLRWIRVSGWQAAPPAPPARAPELDAVGSSEGLTTLEDTAELPEVAAARRERGTEEVPRVATAAFGTEWIDDVAARMDRARMGHRPERVPRALPRMRRVRLVRITPRGVRVFEQWLPSHDDRRT